MDLTPVQTFINRHGREPEHVITYYNEDIHAVDLVVRKAQLHTEDEDSDVLRCHITTPSAVGGFSNVIINNETNESWKGNAPAEIIAHSYIAELRGGIESFKAIRGLLKKHDRVRRILDCESVVSALQCRSKTESTLTVMLQTEIYNALAPAEATLGIV